MAFRIIERCLAAETIDDDDRLAKRSQFRQNEPNLTDKSLKTLPYPLSISSTSVFPLSDLYMSKASAGFRF